MKTTSVTAGIVLLLSVALIGDTSTAQMRSGKLGVGAGGSLYLFNPNLKDNLMKAGGGLGLSYSLMEHLGIRVSIGTGQLGWKNAAADSSFTSTILSGDVKASFDMAPHSAFNPFLYVGAGTIFFDPRADNGGAYLSTGTGISKMDIVYIGGLGFDVFFNEFISMTISGDFIMTNTNKLDMMKSGTANESFSRVNLEFRYYFFDQNYITKLLKALQDRYEKK